MNFMKIIQQRKYLQRLLLSFSLLMTLFLGISSLSLYYTARNTAINIQNNANIKILSQISFNVSFMTGILQNLTMSIYQDPYYFNNNLARILAGTTNDTIEANNKMRLLNTTVSSTPFLHSIMIYNGISGTTYSTYDNSGYLNTSITFQKPIEELITATLPKLQLIPVNFTKLILNPKSETTLQLFSFFMYDFSEQNNTINNALVMNVNPEWLINNIKALNETGGNQESTIIILDGNGNKIISDNKLSIPFEHLKSRIQQISVSSTPGYFILNSENDKKLVTFVGSKVNDWKIISIQSYKSMLQPVVYMRNTSIVVTLLLLFFSMVCSVLVSQRLYRPIENILIQLKSKPNAGIAEDLKERDELRLFSSVYSRMQEDLNKIKKDTFSQKDIIRNFHLRKLVTQSKSMTMNDFVAIVQNYNLDVQLDGRFIIIVAKIDHYEEIKSRKLETEKNLYTFAIGNISQEILSRFFRNEFVDLRSDHYVFLIHLDTTSKSEIAEAKIVALLKEIQENVQKYYTLSLTFALSDPFDHPSKMTENYELALHYAMYRLIFGRQSIITSQMVQFNMNNMEGQIPSELERKLTETVRSGNTELIREQIEKILLYISTFHYTDIIHSIFQIIAMIKRVQREINRNKLHSLSVDLNHINEEVLKKETMVEISEIFRVLLENISEIQQTGQENKQDILIETVKELIVKNYTDINLSLQSISAMLNMSSDYLGKIFKMSQYISVSEYINEVRLEQTLSLLENNENTIKQIMHKSGFINESNFFRNFKKKYGVTPREYRVNKQVNKQNDPLNR